MKKVINFFRPTLLQKGQWNWNWDRVETVGIVLWFALFAIVGGIFGYKISNVVKATDEDYAPLYEQLEIIKEDFDSIYDMDNAKMIFEKSIEVELSSKEYNLIVKFNKERTEVLSINKVYNGPDVLLIIIWGVSIGIIIGALLVIIIAFIIFAIGWIIHRVKKIMHSVKIKKIQKS